MAAVLETVDHASGASAPTPKDAPTSQRGGTLVSGTYLVRERLGAGGMGEVYEVEHLRLGRTFAAKFLRADASADPAAVARIEREARALALVRSAHVVGVCDRGFDAQGLPFFVMERLFGSDLRTLLRRDGALAVPRACALLIAAAKGLRAVHAAGLVHGDVKPGNVFVCPDADGVDTCKLLDLGLAHSALEPRLAGAERGAGTVRYMAPEQLAGGDVSDRRTDIYALGAVLYECLSGRPPHDGECVERTIYAIMHARPVSFAEHDVPIPSELERAVFCALAIDPAARFADVQRFIDALTPFTRSTAAQPSQLAEPEDTTGEIRGSWLPKPARRRTSPLRLLAAGAVVGASIALLPQVMGLHGGTPLAPSPPRLPRVANASDVPRAGRSPATPPAVAVATSVAKATATPALAPARPKPPFPHLQRTGERAPLSTVLPAFDRNSPYDVGTPAP